MATIPKNVRKAAIVLASLDDSHTETLLRQMSPAQAHVLREAMGCLGDIEAGELEDVIEEFFRVGLLLPEQDTAGIELDSPSASLLSSATDHTPRFGTQESTTPFRFLQEAAPHKLVPFLKREHPQTVAVVVSHLPADRAAEVLAHLPSELQIDVARRLVALEEADPEVLREVERGLETWLCRQVQGDRRQSAGVSALANILSAADPQARHHILSNLARHDRHLADRLETPAAPPLSFADLECMDSASLTVVLHHADPELTILALAGARAEFTQRVTDLLGAGGVSIRHAVRNLGPTRLSDVEDAQQQLAELARNLEQRGEIVPEVRGRLSLAV